MNTPAVSVLAREWNGENWYSWWDNELSPFPSVIKRGHFKDTDKTKNWSAVIWTYLYGFSKDCLLLSVPEEKQQPPILFFFSNSFCNCHLWKALYYWHNIHGLRHSLIKTTKLIFPSSHPFPIPPFWVYSCILFPSLYLTDSPTVMGPWPLIFRSPACMQNLLILR